MALYADCAIDRQHNVTHTTGHSAKSLCCRSKPSAPGLYCEVFVAQFRRNESWHLRRPVRQAWLQWFPCSRWSWHLCRHSAVDTPPSSPRKHISVLCDANPSGYIMKLAPQPRHELNCFWKGRTLQVYTEGLQAKGLSRQRGWLRGFSHLCSFNIWGWHSPHCLQQCIWSLNNQLNMPLPDLTVLTQVQWCNGAYGFSAYRQLPGFVNCNNRWIYMLQSGNN